MIEEPVLKLPARERQIILCERCGMNEKKYTCEWCGMDLCEECQWSHEEECTERVI